MKKQIALFAIAAAALIAAPAVVRAQDAAPAKPDTTAPAAKKHSGTVFHGKVTAVDTTAMTLTSPIQAMPDLSMPLPADWAADYTQATHRMNCADPLDSDLLIYPENRVPHGGGMLIMPTGPEAMLMSTWVTAP